MNRTPIMDYAATGFFSGALIGVMIASNIKSNICNTAIMNEIYQNNVYRDMSSNVPSMRSHYSENLVHTRCIEEITLTLASTCAVIGFVFGIIMGTIDYLLK